jgi:SagB-type dehydrogenase family enzyme
MANSGCVSLSLAPGVTVSRAGPSIVAVERPPLRIRLKLLDHGTAAALLRLAQGPAGRDELDRVATGALPSTDLGRLDTELARLSGKSLIHYSCVIEGKELMRAVPTSVLARFRFPALPESAQLRLSRFAYMRRLGDDMILESPTSYARVTLRWPVLGELVAAFASSRGVGEISEIGSGGDPAALHASTAFLHGVGVLATTDQRGETEEDASSSTAQREFHDVVFHAGSRAGLTDSPKGGTYRFKGSIAPAPAVRASGPEPSVQLPSPDLNRVMKEDSPLAQVMETRRSLREHGDRPITTEQLGEFLYRVARIRAVNKIDAQTGRFYESSSRTYPSGGGVYDIELYITIGDCTGLQPGVYRYEPLSHQLTLICDRVDLVRRMLLDAYSASGRVALPHTVITLASRFTRVSWKYESIAYSLTLKNAGVLYEAMYLAATAMNLAGCGIGCGDAALFSLITGLDPLVESSVGEFMLGACRQEAEVS